MLHANTADGYPFSLRDYQTEAAVYYAGGADHGGAGVVADFHG